MTAMGRERTSWTAAATAAVWARGRGWTGRAGGATGVLVSLGALAVLGTVASRFGWAELARPLATVNLSWLSVALALARYVEGTMKLRWRLLLGLDAGTLPALAAT